MSAFADFHVSFGGDGPPAPSRRPGIAWQAAGSAPGAWDAFLAAPSASTLVQTRDVAPWSVWLIGEIARYDSLSAPADPLGAFVLDLRAGRERAAALDGHFLLFAWNASSHEWHVWTDRFGTMHAYWALGARRAALGTFHPAASRAVGASTLDWEALCGFFAMGYFPEDRTHFQDVRILRPASHSVFSERGALLRSARYWEWWHETDRGLSFDAAVEVFGERLSDVLRAQMARGRIAVPISGGLDSRATAAMVDGANARLWFYSYGYGSRSVETRIARKVAAARGAVCDTFEIGEYLFDRMDDVLAATEGFNDVTQTRQIAVSGQLAGHGDAVIAAHWGDVWLDAAGPDDEDVRSRGERTLADAAAERVVKEGSRWLLENVAAPRVKEQPAQLVRDAITRDLARIPQMDDPDFRLKAFKTDSWSFRWTCTGVRSFQLGAFPRLPFYDSRMSDLFATLPSAFVRERRLQVEWLKRFAPDLARITWQQHDADLFHYQYAGSLLLPKRAIKKAWRLITRTKIIERNWEVQFLSARGRERLTGALGGSGKRIHEFVSPAAICTLLDAFFARPLEEKRGYTVSMLLTFSEWLERYA